VDSVPCGLTEKSDSPCVGFGGSIWDPEVAYSAQWDPLLVPLSSHRWLLALGERCLTLLLACVLWPGTSGQWLWMSKTQPVHSAWRISACAMLNAAWTSQVPRSSSPCCSAPGWAVGGVRVKKRSPALHLPLQATISWLHRKWGLSTSNYKIMFYVCFLPVICQ
jgi:hypothetical protein